MLLAEGIAMLSIAAPVLGRMDTVHPVLLWDEQSAVLVDTGYPKQLAQLQDEAKRYDVAFDKLRHILLTHQDIDHIGNLPEIVSSASNNIQVYAHELEKPYIQGERRLLRFTDEAIASIDLLPPQVPETFKVGLRVMMLNPPQSPVDQVIAGGQRLPWYGGLLVINTPGHTPGHISLYHEQSGTLIAGDALVVQEGQLCGPDKETTLDMKSALASLHQLSALDIRTVVCYHGGIFRGEANHLIAELAAAKVSF